MGEPNLESDQARWAQECCKGGNCPVCNPTGDDESDDICSICNEVHTSDVPAGMCEEDADEQSDGEAKHS